MPSDALPNQGPYLYYVLHGNPAVERFGVTVKACANLAQAADGFFDCEPLACSARPLPPECCCVFSPKLKQSNMPVGIQLEDFQRVASLLIVHGWELAEGQTREGCRNLAAVSEEAVPGLAHVLEVLRTHLPNMERVLSRLLLEGQFAYKDAHQKVAVA